MRWILRISVALVVFVMLILLLVMMIPADRVARLAADRQFTRKRLAPDRTAHSHPATQIAVLLPS